MKGHELTMAAANDIPLDELVRLLEAAIARYKSDPTKNNRVTMANCCHLMLYKECIATRGYEGAKQQIGKIVQAGDIMRMQKPENG